MERPDNGVYFISLTGRVLDPGPSVDNEVSVYG